MKEICKHNNTIKQKQQQTFNSKHTENVIFKCILTYAYITAHDSTEKMRDFCFHQVQNKHQGCSMPEANSKKYVQKWQ